MPPTQHLSSHPTPDNSEMNSGWHPQSLPKEVCKVIRTPIHRWLFFLGSLLAPAKRHGSGLANGSKGGAPVTCPSDLHTTRSMRCRSEAWDGSGCLPLPLLRGVTPVSHSGTARRHELRGKPVSFSDHPLFSHSERVEQVDGASALKTVDSRPSHSNTGRRCVERRTSRLGGGEDLHRSGPEGCGNEGKGRASENQSPNQNLKVDRAHTPSLRGVPKKYML